jgi:hypothetical protein
VEEFVRRSIKASWFRMVSVRLDNATELRRRSGQGARRVARVQEHCPEKSEAVRDRLPVVVSHDVAAGILSACQGGGKRRDAIALQNCSSIVIRLALL